MDGRGSCTVHPHQKVYSVGVIVSKGIQLVDI